jgi:hypothetical protein
VEHPLGTLDPVSSGDRRLYTDSLKGEAMPKYVIERNMPGAGALSPDELAAISEKSCIALEEIGPHIQWVESFVTADKVYSVYIARDHRVIREHAYLSGFPADTICEVKAVIDPSTAREARWTKEHNAAKESGVY